MLSWYLGYTVTCWYLCTHIQRMSKCNRSQGWHVQMYDRCYMGFVIWYFQKIINVFFFLEVTSNFMSTDTLSSTHFYDDIHELLVNVAKTLLGVDKVMQCQNDYFADVDERLWYHEHEEADVDEQIYNAFIPLSSVHSNSLSAGLLTNHSNRRKQHSYQSSSL